MPPALAHKLEQTTPRVLVLLVDLEMVDERIDAIGQDSDLDLRRPRITGVNVVFLDDGILFKLRESHCLLLAEMWPEHRWNTEAHVPVRTMTKV